MPESKAKRIKLLIKRAKLVLFFCLTFSSVYAAAPTIGTISPSIGTTNPNIAKAFTCTYSDVDGWANLKEVYLLIGTSSTALTNSTYLYYSRNTNLLYLRNDANTAWLGGFTPGSANTIENSQVKLNCISTIVSGLSNTLTVKFNLTFKPVYSGKAYSSYLKVTDDTNLSVGWTKKGNYTVSYKPVIGTLSPASGTSFSGQSVNFTTTYFDSDGWVNLQYVYFLVNTSTSGASCLYAYYNQNTNKLYLRNDANTSWLGGYSPGSNYVIENSFAKLNCAATVVSGSMDTLAINWRVVFKDTFPALKMFIFTQGMM